MTDAEIRRAIDRYTACHDAVLGTVVFGTDHIATLRALLEVRELLGAIRKAVAEDVRPEQAADYILSRAGFNEREIEIAVRVAVEATNKERQRVRAFLAEGESA